MIQLAEEEFARRAKACRLLVLDVDGVLTDGSIVLGEREECKAFHSQDGLGVTLARAAGLRVAVITGRSSAAVSRRARELHLDHVLQGRPDKAAALEELCAAAGVRPEETACMGDDWLDLPLMARAGLAACPADARPEVAERCHFVAACPGGRGAVREFVDRLLRARGQHEELLERCLRGEGPAASTRDADVAGDVDVAGDTDVAGADTGQ